LPEVDAARALARQRVHHRAALIALASLAVLVQGARVLSERTLPPVLPEVRRAPPAQAFGAAATLPSTIPAAPLAAPEQARPEPVKIEAVEPNSPASTAPTEPDESLPLPASDTSSPTQLAAAVTRPDPVPTSKPPQPGQPWTNSLGMPFAAVPKLPVLVAIWETRVRDFEAFANASGSAWKFTGGDAEREHPVVDVSYADATRFCQWLTEKELAAGLLMSGQHYRLPTDLEWSAAAGLPSETGVTLRERDDPTDVLFAWGKQWPPPPLAGNFRGRNPKGSDPDGLAGAGDVFDGAAPVGSFSPNRFGLFDLAGNVAEMVSDLIAPELGLHATRGGSFNDAGQRALRLGARGVGEDDRRGAPHIGFRVVLNAATPP
jgi:formylglycine-generating enzyme required for sulfatase activity